MQEKTESNDRVFVASAEKAGERLDVFCSRLTEQTRSYIEKIICIEKVTVNGKTEKSGYKLRQGDEVIVLLPPPQEDAVLPQDIPLDIIYQDDYIAVINKPKGMVVHPAPGNYSNTMVNALMHHIGNLSGIGGVVRPGIVHRIDKLTSGLIIVAKNDAAHISLSKQIAEHKAGRTYIALVNGNIKEDILTINSPIARSRADRKKMIVMQDGRSAVTNIKVLKRYGAYTLVAASLETGRTHQIRVHMASIGHNVVGDTLYGSGKSPFKLEGQALHAIKLKFTHPETGREMTFYAPLPDYFLGIMRALNEEGIYEILDKEIYDGE